MSQFDPPQPPGIGSEQEALDYESMSAGPPPMSGMAVAGFVSSVIFCCPVLSPLLGLLFSLIGLAQTKGGVRRGRGLAIAGLVIALIFIPIHAMLGVWTVRMGAAGTRIEQAVMTLQNSDVSGQVQAIYDIAAPSFREQVGEPELRGWLERHFKGRGGVQDAMMSTEQAFEPLSDNRIRYNWVISFPSESVVLATDFQVDVLGAKLELVDLAIDGESAVQTLGDGGPAEGQAAPD